MNDFESYFASLEEKIQKGSRLQIIKDANEENNRAYKVNDALLLWFKLEKLTPLFLICFVLLVVSLSSLFFSQNKSNASLKVDQGFLSLEYSYVDAIKDDFPWENLELKEDIEKEIRFLATGYLEKKHKILDQIEHLNKKNYDQGNRSDLELEISDLNYQLKLLE